ncbi:ATP-binding cassette domain-containing protein [Shigella flexneri]
MQAIDLKKHYPVKKGMFAPERLVKALDGVSFNLERGKTLAVVGESGCGKTTLGSVADDDPNAHLWRAVLPWQGLLKHDRRRAEAASAENPDRLPVPLRFC